MFEIVPRRLAMQWMLIEHRNLFNTSEGFVRNLCCTFAKSSKQIGFGEKSFCCSSRECCSMHARWWSTFGTILGPIRLIIQFAIFLLKVCDIYSNVGKETLKKFLLFPSTYLCESGFYPSARENKKNETYSTLL